MCLCLCAVDALLKCEAPSLRATQHSCHESVFLLVTSVIMQKNGAGLHTASSCYWDNTTDGEVLQIVWAV